MKPLLAWTGDKGKLRGSFIASLVAALFFDGAVSVDSQADEIALQNPIPDKIAEIEIIYPEGRAPTVALKRQATPKTVPGVKPTAASLNLLPLLGTPRPGAQCSVVAERSPESFQISLKRIGEDPCRQTFSLKQKEALLDVLSYGTLRLKGTANGEVELRLLGEVTSQTQTSTLISRLSGDFDIWLSLGTVAKGIDLRRVSEFETAIHHKEARLALEILSLERLEPRRQSSARLGFWVWDYRQVLANFSTLFDHCRRAGADRIFLQIPSLEEGSEIWTSYVSFFKEAKKAGIEVYALDGYPEAIYSPAPLIDKLLRLQQLLGSTDLPGVQLDVEPYLLAEFFAIDSGFAKYLETIDKVKSAMHKTAKLSVAIPFWFSEQSINGRAVAFEVMDRVDEVAVMSYRTDMDQVRAIAQDTLRYGDLVGKRVWLGLETVPLKPERYVTLTPEPRHNLADAYLDRKKQRLVLKSPGTLPNVEGFRIQRRITVRPERITFAGQRRKKIQDSIEVLLSKIANPSLVGVVIHDLKAFWALPE